jgi:hypothetical protein
MDIITAADMLEIGQELVGFSKSRQTIKRHTQIVRFMAHFGTCPVTCAAIYLDLQTTPNRTARIEKPDIKRFFMALYWLKTYGTEAQLAGEFNVDEKTVRKWVAKYVDAMQALKGQKVRAKTWPNYRCDDRQCL